MGLYDRLRVFDVCKLSLYRNNVDLILPGLDPKLQEMLQESYAPLSVVKRVVGEAAPKHGLKAFNTSSTAYLMDRQLSVRCLMIGFYANFLYPDLQLLVGRIGDVVGLEQPQADLFFFNHPPVKVMVRGVKGDLVLRGQAAIQERRPRIELNIHKVDGGSLKELAYWLVELCLKEQAFVMPEEKVVKAYVEAALNKLPEGELDRMMLIVKDVAEEGYMKFKSLSDELEGKALRELRRVGEVARAFEEAYR